MYSMEFTARNLPKRYRSKSWINLRAEVHSSSINGKGMFACKSIVKSEIIVIWGGRVFSEAEIKGGKARERSIAMLDEGLYIGSLLNEPENFDEFMNHSCDPNIWLQDEITLVAKQDIAEGEEITTDYALWETDPHWQMKCFCKSPFCRHLITGNDWKLKELQSKYQKHFSPYVVERIRNLNGDKSLYNT